MRPCAAIVLAMSLVACASEQGPRAIEPAKGDGRTCGALDEAACVAREGVERDGCVVRRHEGGAFDACTSTDHGECTAAPMDVDPSADPAPCGGVDFPSQETSPYVLPYPVGVTHNIRQGNCNAANTHNGPEEYAYDFEMPIGSELVAVRGGRVFAVVERFTDDQHGADQGNVLAIDHGDRTYAKYGHLTFNGGLVEVGDVVEQGQRIALSGNSGISRAPHLHFAVKHCPEGTGLGTAGCVGIPVTFSNTIPHPNGLIGSPTSELGGGRWYPACAR